MKSYDQICTKIFSDHIDIEYGILEGSNTILFIKVGQGGNIYGYENKYLHIAHRMRAQFGYTVIVSSNPFNGQNPLDQAMDVMGVYAESKGFLTYEVHYMGHSNGALIGFTWGHLYPQIKKMLLINGPLMVNWHRSKAGLAQIKDKTVTFVYGEKDPSHFFVGHLKPFAEESEQIHLVTVDNADHHFKGMLEAFIALPEIYLGAEMK